MPSGTFGNRIVRHTVARVISANTPVLEVAAQDFTHGEFPRPTGIGPFHMTVTAMPKGSGRIFSDWFAPKKTIATTIAAAFILTCSSAGGAAAQSGGAAPTVSNAPPAVPGNVLIAPGLSDLDVLVIENAIEQNWAEYTLLFDGDGVKSELGDWAARTFTKDLKWRWYDADGKLQMAANSQDEMDKEPRIGRLQGPYRHLPISIHFDEVGPRQVRTRTTVLFLSVPVSPTAGGRDGVPGTSLPGVPQTGMAVYHDTWRKEGDRWMKSISILHSSNLGFWPGHFMPTKSCPNADLKAPGCAP